MSKQVFKLLGISYLVTLAGITAVTCLIYKVAHMSDAELRGEGRHAHYIYSSSYEDSSVPASHGNHHHAVEASTRLPSVNAALGARIQKLESRSASNAVIHPLADGSVVADLRGHFRSTVVAVVDDAGDVHISHGGNFPVQNNNKGN